MSKDSLDVDYVARLARLELSADEKNAFSSQLAEVVDHVRQLESVDLSPVEGSGENRESQNHLRDDVPAPCLTRESILKNAPQATDEEIVMPKIVD